MPDPADPQQSHLVRCLHCRTEYALPPTGGAVRGGCPECGYVGWVALSIPPLAVVPRPLQPPPRPSTSSG